MKNLLHISYLFLAIFTLFSCNSDDYEGQYKILVPVIEDMNVLRNNIAIHTARSTSAEDGKIYVTSQYLFYIAQESGIHIFDNSNPESPQNIAFIEIPGVHDIAIKNNFLYADNYVDLVVFDIANLNQIQQIQTLENVINFYAEFFTEEYDGFDYSSYENWTQNNIVTGYRIERRASIPENYEYLADGENGVPGMSNGTGGSYAKFQINNNALYTTDSWRINVFDITTPDNTSFVNYYLPEGWVGQFETMYKLKNFLFIGSTQGMAVFDATNEFNLHYVSDFSHATGCDPVVANEDFVYLTIRGGNTCGAVDSQVNVINIQDITAPYLMSSYLLDEPYGLGIHYQTIYVGTGENGLKIFDASNPEQLILMNELSVNSYDVIPLYDRLIVVGGQKITQFAYGDNFTLEEISSIQF